MFKKLCEVTTSVLPELASQSPEGVERTEQTHAKRIEDWDPPEEKISRHLSEHEGSMWQRNIVAETGWSDAKTSRALCAMEEEGRIIRYTIGREKAVFLPGQQPTNIALSNNETRQENTPTIN